MIPTYMELSTDRTYCTYDTYDILARVLFNSRVTKYDMYIHTHTQKKKGFERGTMNRLVTIERSEAE